MTTTHNSIPNADVFEVLRNDHGLILPEYEVARLTSAFQGVQTIAALLQQRELDEEMGAGEGVFFGPNVGIGLLAALASCAALAQAIVETGGLLGARAEFGGPAYTHLAAAVSAVEQANRKEVKP